MILYGSRKRLLSLVESFFQPTSYSDWRLVGLTLFELYRFIVLAEFGYHGASEF